MQVALMHRFSKVGPRGKRRTYDGEKLVNMSVADGRVVAKNAKGNIMVDCSVKLWDTLLSREYVTMPSDPWSNI